MAVAVFTTPDVAALISACSKVYDRRKFRVPPGASVAIVPTKLGASLGSLTFTAVKVWLPELVTVKL